MAQQELHIAQVRTAAQGVRGKGVTEGVRRDVGDIGLVRIRLEDKPEALARQAVAAMVEEERVFFPQDEAWPRVLQVVADRLNGSRAKRNPPLPERAAGAAQVP